MTTLRTAAQQALQAMDKATRFMSDSDYRKLNEAIEALKAALVEDAMQKFTDVNQELEAALAKPMQEPVIRYDGLYEYAHQHALDYNDLCRVVRAAITAPPQRKPLDDLAIADIYAKWDATPGISMADFARAVERAHGIT